VCGNWPALAILLVLPAGVLIHRIFVEEAVLTEVIGRAYTDYAAGTKRLVPGLCDRTEQDNVRGRLADVVALGVGDRGYPVA
jgi:hypothetical protein